MAWLDEYKLTYSPSPPSSFALSLYGKRGGTHKKKMYKGNVAPDSCLRECAFQVDGNSATLSMSVHFKQLKRLVEEHTFSQILIPLQSVLIATLPSTGGANTQHDAFPGHWAYLDGFEDIVRKIGC